VWITGVGKREVTPAKEKVPREARQGGVKPSNWEAWEGNKGPRRENVCKKNRGKGSKRDAGGENLGP